MRELLRSYLVFSTCTIKPIVRRAAAVVSLLDSTIGSSATSFLLEHTFFAQFCGGTSAQSIRSTVDRLSRAGICSILDYAAEADVAPGVEPKPAVEAAAGSTEAAMDANLDVIMCGVRDAAAARGFAAVKLSGLAPPALLLHVSSMLREHDTAFQTILSRVGDVDPTPPAAPTAVAPSGSTRPVLPRVSRASFLNAIPAPLHADAAALFAFLDTARPDGYVDALEWGDGLAKLRLEGRDLVSINDGQQLPNIAATASRVLASLLRNDTGSSSLISSPLGPAEVASLASLHRRAETVATAAASSGVTLLIDAEQTYLQPAVDWVALGLMQRYNRSGSAAVAGSGAAQPLVVVYTTVQAYLRDAPDRLALTLARAELEGWDVGVKLVRGAYLASERRRAAELGYTDPTQTTLEATHAAYAQCADMMLADGGPVATRRGEAMFATHNVASVQAVVSRVWAMGLPPASCGVSFGQLLGMCDDVTYTLAAKGFRAFKYLPYGPVREVVPYLIRRMEENSDLLHSGVGKELTLLRREIWQRALRVVRLGRVQQQQPRTEKH